MFKILGINYRISKRFNFFYYDYHLAFYTKFIEANACKTICIGCLMINIWAVNEEWNKELNLPSRR